jgi:predicted Zn-dependent protease
MKRSVNTTSGFSTFFIALLCCGLAVAQKQLPPPSANVPHEITGQLRFPNTSSGPAGFLVILNRGTGMEVDRSMTDSRGRFHFGNLQPDSYQVVVQQRGYRTVSRDVDLNYSPAMFVNIDVVPLPGPRPDVPASGIVSARLPANDTAREEFAKGQKLLVESKDPKDTNSGISHLQKAMKADPAFGPTYALLGKAYMDQQNLKEAETVMRKGIEADTKDFSLEFFLGVCLNQERDFASAEKALLRSLEIDPHAFQAHYELSRTYLAMNQWQKAEPHIAEAIKIEPRFAPPHVAMGNILLKKGDPHAAQEQYEEYLKLDPSGPFAAGVKGMLEKMKAGPTPP